MYIFEWVEHLLLVKMDWNANDSLLTTNPLLVSSVLITQHLSTLDGKVVLQMKKV